MRRSERVSATKSLIFEFCPESSTSGTGSKGAPKLSVKNTADTGSAAPRKSRSVFEPFTSYDSRLFVGSNFEQSSRLLGSLERHPKVQEARQLAEENLELRKTRLRFCDRKISNQRLPEIRETKEGLLNKIFRRSGGDASTDEFFERIANPSKKMISWKTPQVDSKTKPRTNAEMSTRIDDKYFYPVSPGDSKLCKFVDDLREENAKFKKSCGSVDGSEKVAAKEGGGVRNQVRKDCFVDEKGRRDLRNFPEGTKKFSDRRTFLEIGLEESKQRIPERIFSHIINSDYLLTDPDLMST